MTKYWIAVASKNHVMYGAAHGIVMANHGKRSGIAWMHKGDGFIYYSPKVTFEGKEPLRAFTAIGEIADDTIEQVEMTPDFKPFQRRGLYRKTGEVPIEPLIGDLTFIRNKQSWGYVFRFGLIGIPEQDFRRIGHAFDTLPQ